MTSLDLFGILMVLAAACAFINHRFVKLPAAIGIMLLSLVASILLLLVSLVVPGLAETMKSFVESIEFDDTLMEGMLSFLLFAGALHVNLDDLKKEWGLVMVLATVGVVVSAFLIGFITFGLADVMGFQIPFIWCLAFGALIAPTDPVAVLGILKSVGAPKSLETKITGESLFNDGVGVVVFLAILATMGTAGGHGDADALSIAKLFVIEAGGGILLGLAAGYGCYRLLRSVDAHQVEVLLTIALVAGASRFAHATHVSGPLAMVVAGLLLGNHGRSFAMSDDTRDHLDKFWMLLDETLNAVLFMLIGLELFVLELGPKILLFSACLIPLSLLVRFIAVAGPVTVLKKVRTFSPGVIKILTWGGLRGGISIALALSLPPGPERDILLTATYVIVVFSVAVQGTTLKGLIQKNLPASSSPADSGH